MDALAELADAPAAQKALGPFVKQCRDWIADQKKVLPSLTPKRREMAEVLLDQRTATTANRIVASAPLTRPIWMCLMYWMNRPYQEDRRRSYY